MLDPHGFLSLASYTTQDHQPKDGCSLSLNCTGRGVISWPCSPLWPDPKASKVLLSFSFSLLSLSLQFLSLPTTLWLIPVSQSMTPWFKVDLLAQRGIAVAVQTMLPRQEAAAVGWVLTHQTSIKKMSPQACLHANPMEPIPQLRFLFPSDSA